MLVEVSPVEGKETDKGLVVDIWLVCLDVLD